MYGTGYILLEEVGCLGSTDGNITKCVGVFEHRACAEIAYEYMVDQMVKAAPSGVWWLYLEEIELGEMYPRQDILRTEGILESGERTSTTMETREVKGGAYVV